MTRRHSILSPLATGAASVLLLASTACHRPSAEERAAAPIVEKNVAARGGLDAWKKVQSLSMTGVLDAGRRRDPAKLAASYTRTPAQARAAARKVMLHGADPADAVVQLPFTMELKRPHDTRVEVQFQGQTAVQVWDGKHGWKLRPFLGRHEVEPYTPEEVRIASEESELDGPLVDAARKGNRIALVGTDKVDGRDAYQLQVTDRDGHVRHVWVDAETFLDVKIDGSRRMDGKPRPIFTYLRDYRTVNGVKIPFLVETAVEGVKDTEKMRIEKVAVNTVVDDSRFSKPD